MTHEPKDRSRVPSYTVFAVSTLLTIVLSAGCEKPPPATTSTPAANPDEQKALRMYAAEVAAAAERLLEITPAEERVLLALPFDREERFSGRRTKNTPNDAPPFCAVLAWCLPGWGLPQGSMDQQQLVAMHKMLSLSLSSGGYQTLLAVLERQRIIGEMEDVADPNFVAKQESEHPDTHASSAFDFGRPKPVTDFYPSVGGGFPAGW